MKAHLRDPSLLRDAVADMEDAVAGLKHWSSVAYLAAAGLTISTEREAFRELCAEIERRSDDLRAAWLATMKQVGVESGASCA